jgi:hypothetical protein
MGDAFSLVVNIGGIPIRLRTVDSGFHQLLHTRYFGFLGSADGTFREVSIELAPDAQFNSQSGARARLQNGVWMITRRDFQGFWNPGVQRGQVRQTANPYSIDSFLRIVHTLILAEEGGFLVHASSVIRNGGAFLFAGPSGAGKTTIASLAPSDTTLLTDEISYVRFKRGEYHAWGTPFAGELASSGENVSAAVAGVFFLSKGATNQVDLVSSGEAVRELLKSILFFSDDWVLVRQVFKSACGFISGVPARRLTFVPDVRVWELIR